MLDKELQETLEKLKAQFKKRDAVLDKIMARSDRELKRLSGDELLTEPSEYLANICVELDATYNVGTTLALDWMLNSYFEMEFERRVQPWLSEVYEALKAGGYTEKNPVDQFRGLAYYVPHDEKKIFVHEDSFLVIFDTSKIFEGVYVRSIWPRIRRDCIGHVDHPTLAYYRKRNFAPWEVKGLPGFYGDCRDRGHVFTFTKFPRTGVDHVIWDIGRPMRWFMAMNSTWTDLVNTEESSGLSDPESVRRHYKKVS